MRTLGSLFDGSGGFPLAGSLCGIVPKWAAEVEPYPIAVTRLRLPGMRHLGDITQVNGAGIDPVDIITFGSPCQDLSVAGKRAGLKHEANGDEETTRSGLFMEAVRIIKEMREETNGLYPTFALWENVPGAFSSNGGEDFRTVLEELIRIVEPNATMPPVPKGGWAHADSYRGDGWSLAYRVFDAQYWGVPQRRRRIHLVVDFAGGRAGEVLFEREGVRGHFTPCGAQGQGTAAHPEGSPASDDRAGEPGKSYDIGEARLRTPSEYTEVAPTLTARCGTGGNNTPAVVYCLQGNGIDRALTAGCNGKGWREDASYTLNTLDRPAVAYLASGKKTVGTLMANAGTKLWLGNQEAFSGDYHIIEENQVRYIVRRLTPTECARLQGFPDAWGHIDHKVSMTPDEHRFWADVRNTHAAINGKPAKEYTEAQMLAWYNKLHTDGAEYKMWGNGIALPPALYCMQGMADALNREEDTHE